MPSQSPPPLLVEPPAFRDAAEEFGLCNLQPEAPQLAILERLKNADFQDILVLSGPTGIGRSFLVRAAQARARWDGVRTRLEEIDLGVAEPGLPWSEQLEGLLKTAAAKDEGAGWGELLRSLRPQGVELPFADTSLSLALALGVPIKLFTQWLGAGDPAAKPGALEPRELVRKLLGWLTEDVPAVVHIRDGDLLDQARWSLFLDEAAINGRILVTTSAAQGNTSTHSFEHRRFRSVIRFELGVIEREDELAELLRLRLTPFDASLSSGCDALAAAIFESRDSGAPEELSQRLARLLRSGALEQEADGEWTLRGGSLDGPEALEALGVSTYGRLREILDGLGEELGGLLEDVLYLGSCCGEQFPVDAALEFLDPAGSRIDDVKDAIDTFLADDDERCVLRDLEFSAPGIGFQSSVYAFRIPLFRSVVLANLRPLSVDRLVQFGRYLRRRIPVRTRAAAAMHLTLAHHCGDADFQKQTLEQQRHFIELDACEFAEKDLSERLASGELDPDVLCSVIERVSRAWAPQRVLALITALEGYGVPVSKRVAVASARGAQFHRMGRLSEAEVAMCEALAMLGADERYEGCDHAILTVLENVTVVLRDRGDWKSARVLAERVLRGRAAALGEGHPRTLLAMGYLGQIQRIGGEMRESCGVFERAVRQSARAQGEAHPQTLDLMFGFAESLGEAGAVEGSTQVFQRLLQLQNATLGDEHPATLKTKGAFAYLLRRAGQIEPAKQLLEPALISARRVLGEGHIETLQLVSELAMALQVSGDDARAGELYEAAYEGHQRASGPEAPRTLAAAQQLATFYLAHGSARQSRELFERTLAIHERLHGERHPTTLKLMEGLGCARDAEGNLEGGRTLLERALKGRVAVLGDRALAVQLSRLNLASLMAKQGDSGGARSLLEVALKVVRETRPEADGLQQRFVEALERLDR